MAEGLAQTVDSLNEDLFHGRPADPAGIAFVLSRQGLPGSYRGLFAPSTGDRPLRLFTGETITTGAGSAHVLSEECMRVLAAAKATKSPVYATAREIALGFLDTEITGHY